VILAEAEIFRRLQHLQFEPRLMYFIALSPCHLNYKVFALVAEYVCMI